MAAKNSDENTTLSSNNFEGKGDASVPMSLQAPFHSELSGYPQDNVKEALISKHTRTISATQNKNLGRPEKVRGTISLHSIGSKSIHNNKGRNVTKKGTQVQKRTFLRKQQEEHSLGIILILMSILFIICQSLKIVPDMYEIIVCRSAETYENSSQSCVFPDIILKLTNISHLLLCINSSANFLIYYCAGGKFREAWLDTYGCWW